MEKSKMYQLCFLAMATSALADNIGIQRAGELVEELLTEEQMSEMYEDIGNLSPEDLTQTLKLYVKDGIEAYLGGVK